jgi:threonine aldolase
MEKPLTAQLIDQTRELFETDCQVFMVYSGTAANSLSLSALVQPYQSIVAHQTAHIQVDECSAPEFFTGGAKTRQRWRANTASSRPNRLKPL